MAELHDPLTALVADPMARLVERVLCDLMLSQRQNPAWSKAELWGIERDIIPALRQLVRKAIDAAVAEAEYARGKAMAAVESLEQRIKQLEELLKDAGDTSNVNL